MPWYNPLSWNKSETETAPKTRLPRRNYQSAQAGRLLADFHGGTTSADREIRTALKTLRNRSRQLCRNNPYAARALQIYRTQVCGEKGLSLQVRARNVPTGNDNQGTLDQVGNAAIESEWKDWTRRGICEVTGKHSWIDCQKLVVDSLIRDGEILIHFIRSKGANKFGFQLQFLEADFLDEEYNKDLPNGSRIVMGVEISKTGRPLAYHIYPGSKHPYDEGQFGQAVRTRIPADDILHLYHPERAQQTRGVPVFSNVASKMHMLDAYEESEVVASRLAASKSLFLESADGEGMDADAYEDEFAPMLDTEPGSITTLPPGVKLAPWNPDHPNSAFADFHKNVLRSIASGLGVSYVSLSNNLEGVSYSSIRQGTIEERDNMKMQQRFLIEHFAEPVFREWLRVAVLNRAIPLLQNVSDPMTRIEKFTRGAHFTGRGFEWVDPQKEVNAAVNALNNGFLSYTDIQQRYGRDPEEVFAQLQADKLMAERFGIKLALEPLGAKSPAFPEID
jgi:lambda family phage portal protein